MKGKLGFVQMVINSQLRNINLKILHAFCVK